MTMISRVAAKLEEQLPAIQIITLDVEFARKCFDGDFDIYMECFEGANADEDYVLIKITK